MYITIEYNASTEIFNKLVHFVIPTQLSIPAANHLNVSFLNRSNSFTSSQDNTTILPSALHQNDFYKSYDARKGVHIAALLGSFMVLVVVVLMYKDKKKYVKLFRAKFLDQNNEKMQEEKLLSAWLCYNWFLGGKPSAFGGGNNGLSNSDIHNILCSRLLKQQAQSQKYGRKDSSKRKKKGRKSDGSCSSIRRSIYSQKRSNSSNQTYGQVMRAGIGAAMVPICPSLTEIDNHPMTEFSQFLTKGHGVAPYSPIFYPGHNSLCDEE